MTWQRVILIGLFLAAAVGLHALGATEGIVGAVLGAAGGLAIPNVGGGPKPPGGVSTSPTGPIAALLVLLLMSGCATYKPMPTGGYPAEQCTRVRAKQRFWSAIGAGSAALAGGGGLASAFPDEDDARLVVAISTAGIAVLAAVSGLLSRDYSAELDAFCGRPGL